MREGFVDCLGGDELALLRVISILIDDPLEVDHHLLISNVVSLLNLLSPLVLQGLSVKKLLPHPLRQLLEYVVAAFA